MKSLFRLFSLAAVASLLCASFAWAEDPAADEAMKKWIEAGTPGAPHAMLAAYSGDWTAESKWWQAAQAEPQVSPATATIEMILGGRILHMTYKGDWNGQPWTGIGYIGYDNVAKHYTNIWMDEMSTGIYMSKGAADESGKLITARGTMCDPMTGALEKPTKEIWTFTDADHLKFEMFDNVGTDQEFKAMEINYTRAK